MLVALAAMFGQQTFASVGKTLPAIVAPLVIAELHADPAWVGIYFGLSAAASLVAQMGCGSFIIRYGALRMSQVALVLLGGGMAAAAEGGLFGFGASAIIGGGGAAVSTPTSSQLLGRVSPPRLAPLVFSIKQTAVPAGLLICRVSRPGDGGRLGMARRDAGDRRGLRRRGVMLQPLRARFDDDRVPSRRFRLSDFRTTIASVVTTPDLRTLSFACFAFNGIQSVFTAYFVTYLVALGYELAAAGFLFSIVVARRRAVPRPVGLARQLPCRAAPGDGRARASAWRPASRRPERSARLADPRRSGWSAPWSAPPRCPGTAFCCPRPRGSRRPAGSARSPAAFSRSARSARLPGRSCSRCCCT